MQAFQGRILMFGNLDENKEAHPLSMHMGLPPNTGDKWILTLWFRERDYILNKSDIRKAVKKMESSDKKQAKKQILKHIEVSIIFSLKQEQTF